MAESVAIYSAIALVILSFVIAILIVRTKKSEELVMAAEQPKIEVTPPKAQTAKTEGEAKKGEASIAALEKKEEGPAPKVADDSGAKTASNGQPPTKGGGISKVLRRFFGKKQQQ